MEKRGPLVLVLDRKVALVGTLTLVLILIGIVAIAGPVNNAIPWHFLQQVAKGPTATDTNTVDANNNGIIDEADSCTTCGSGGASGLIGVAAIPGPMTRYSDAASPDKVRYQLGSADCATVTRWGDARCERYLHPSLYDAWCDTGTPYLIVAGQACDPNRVPSCVPMTHLHCVK